MKYLFLKEVYLFLSASCPGMTGFAFTARKIDTRSTHPSCLAAGVVPGVNDPEEAFIFHLPLRGI
jgi:hypothetical protein